MDSRSVGAHVSLDMVGSASAPTSVSWDERDTMLYALGVGAGQGVDGDRELCFTTENSAGCALRALPSMVCVLAQHAFPPAMAQLDAGLFLHAEQRWQLRRPLPVAGRAILINRVQQVLDKGLGKGGILVNCATLTDDQGELLAEVKSSTYVRGAGGFGGPRGLPETWSVPEREPDVRVQQETRPEQALLYRLSGDRHPLHTDPTYARAHGFDRPILHGLCTYGFACRALLQSLTNDDRTWLTGMEGRFCKPVHPGERLWTEIWKTEGDVVLFQVEDSCHEPIIENGRAFFAKL